MGDSCCNNRSIGAVRRRIQEVLGGKIPSTDWSDDVKVQALVSTDVSRSHCSRLHMCRCICTQHCYRRRRSSRLGKHHIRECKCSGTFVSPLVKRPMCRIVLCSDTWSAYPKYTLLQVEDVCRTLAGFPELKDGYNAVGFSQGEALSSCKRPTHMSLILLYPLRFPHGQLMRFCLEVLLDSSSATC